MGASDGAPNVDIVQERVLGAAWQEGSRTRAGELRALTEWVRRRRQATSTTTSDRASEALYDAIVTHLAAVLEAAKSTDRWWQVERAGSRLELAISNLDAAEANLLRIAPADFVLGQMPSIVNHVQRHLKVGDARRTELERISTQLVAAEVTRPETSTKRLNLRPRAANVPAQLALIERERGQIVNAVRGASSAALREQTRLRSFRNVVVVATIAMLAGAIALAVIGAFNPDWMPLCFTPEEAGQFTVVCPTEQSGPEPIDGPAADEPAASAMTTVTSVPTDTSAATDAADNTTGTSTPSGADRQTSTTEATSSTTPSDDRVGARNDVDDLVSETNGRGDIAVVEVLGTAAAAISAAAAIRRVRGSSEPYGIPIALAVLKLPTGALTAFLGLMLMRGEFVPGLSALDTPAQILAWAIVFGYAQQLFTRLVDQQAHSVLDDVRSGNKGSE